MARPVDAFVEAFGNLNSDGTTQEVGKTMASFARIVYDELRFKFDEEQSLAILLVLVNNFTKVN